MADTMRWKEAAGVAAVVAVLLSVPLALGAWHRHMLRQPAHTRVILLTAVAQQGVWTQQEVVGWNYWWQAPARSGPIALQQGDHVVVYVRSADVLHSFAIPLLHVGPVEVPAGHTVKVEFDATRPGTLTFLCWQVCSPDHSQLHGHFEVQGNGSDSW